MEGLSVEDSFIIGPNGVGFFIFFINAILWILGIFIIPTVICIIFVFVVDKISRDRLRNNREIYEETANPKSYKQQEKIDEKEKSFSREEGT